MVIQKPFMWCTISRMFHNNPLFRCYFGNKKDVLNPKEYLGRFYLDSLVHDPKMLTYLVELIGKDKVVLGTDYPFPLGELKPGALIEDSGFGPTIKSKLLGQNALDWLGLQNKVLAK